MSVLECRSVLIINYICNDIINKTCQVVSVVNPTNILPSARLAARVHDCTGYHLLSVNENLCLCNDDEKVTG